MKTYTLVDIRNGTFDSSSLSDFQRCPRRFYHRWIRGIVPRRTASALNAGEQVHRSLAAFTQTKDVETAIATLKGDGAEALWTLPTEGPEAKRHPLNLEKVMRAYFQEYRNEPKRDTIDVELHFAVDMPNGTVLSGMVDELYHTTSGLTKLREHKTCSILTDFYFWKRFEHDLQIIVYNYAVEQLIGECDCVEINAVLIADVKPTKLKKNGEPYAEDKKKIWRERRDFSIQKHVTDNFMDTYLAITNYVTAIPKKQENFYQAHCNCQDYGGCPYKQICLYGDLHLEMAFDIDEKLSVRNHVPMPEVQKVKAGKVFEEELKGEEVKPEPVQEKVRPGGVELK